MTVPASDVAAAIRDRLPDVPTKKLHKLLYYCQGHHLAATGRPLFSETISAWDMGPVVGSLWYAERDVGATGHAARLDEATLNTVGYVVSRYGRLSGLDLERLTHAEAPWRRANEHRRPGESTRMDLEWIREQFEFEAEDALDSSATAVVLDTATVTEWLAGGHDRRHDDLRADSYQVLRQRLDDAS